MSQMFLNVVSTFKGDGLAAATRQLGQFGSVASGFGTTLGKVGAALAGFGLAAKSISFAKDAINEAKNLQQNLFALELVFEGLAPQMQEFAKNSADIGLSQAEAAKASVFLGSVLKQSGFNIIETADKTETLVKLATDLALVYQYDVSEALMGMTALFRGEYDPIEKFGVAMKQSEINAEMTAKKLNHLTGEQRRLAEQTIRYNLFMERATDSIGAFAKSSGNLAAETLKLQAEFANMQATVGTALVPTITDLVIALKPLVEQLTPRLVQVLQDAKPAIEVFNGLVKDAGDETTTTGQALAGFADLLGGAFRIIAGNFGVLLQLTALFLGIRTAIGLANAALVIFTKNPIVASLIAIAAGTIIVADAAKKYNKELEVANRDSAKSAEANQRLANALTGAGMAGSYAADKFGVANTELKKFAVAVDALPTDVVVNVKLEVDSRNKALNDYMRFLTGRSVEAGGGTTGTGGTGTGTGTGGGAKPAAAVLSGFEELNKAQALSVKQAEKQNELLGLKLSQGVVDQILGMAKPVKAANDVINNLTKKDGTVKKKEVTRLNNEFKNGLQEQNRIRAEAAQAAIAQAQEAERLAEELRQAEKARIDGLNQLYANFLDTIKGTFAGIRSAIQGAFDITGLGGSTNAIIRNMNKLLAKMKSFSTNVKSLATMGLDPALLQQVIQAGPIAGSRLAAALVSGGAGALASINAGFGQVGSLASEIATTGVQSLFDTQKQQSVYNITVTGGVGSGSTIGKAIVDAIKDYERTSGAVWQGA
jgi:hypothetical protein